MKINTLNFWRVRRYLRPPCIVVFACLAGGISIPAAAHPMGNFTVNHYSRLTVVPERIQLHWVLDLAELPTITERQEMDGDEDGIVTDSETRAYVRSRSSRWIANLQASIDGKPVEWSLKRSSVTFTPGIANLGVMRVALDLAAPLPPGKHRIVYSDATYRERPGWKEMVVLTSQGVPKPEGVVPSEEISQALLAYPADQLVDPPQVSSVDFTVTVPAIPPPAVQRQPATPAVTRTVRPEPVPESTIDVIALVSMLGLDKPKTVTPPPVARPNPSKVTKRAASPPPVQPSAAGSRWSAMLRGLVTARTLTPGVLLASLLVAFLLGGLHALQPGHGKTLVAAYLVGQRGTARHALLLGLTVTISHTFGVFLLGAVALYGGRYILPEIMAPWMGFASGVLIALIGGGMLLARVRDLQHERRHVREHEHEHGHDHHEHDAPAHSHGLPGEHIHAMPTSISMRSLVVLGISGGIVPCWDALIVLLGAVAIHQTLYGMALIVAFSAGLAFTLTAAGLAVVWGQQRTGLSRLTPQRVRALSMVGNAAVLAIGVVLAVQSLTATGFIAWTG